MIKKILDWLQENLFEDIRYINREHFQAIEGVQFTSEHRAYTGIVGTAKIPAKNLQLYKVLRDKGLNINSIGHKWINGNSLSKQDFKTCFDNELMIYDKRTGFFEIVEFWIVMFKDEKQLNLIKG